MRYFLVEEDKKEPDYLREATTQEVDSLISPLTTNSNNINEDIWNKAGTIYQPKQDSRYKRLIRKPINTLTQEEIKYIFTIHWCWYLANVRRFDSIEDALENTDDRFREEYFNECYEFFHSLSFPLKVYRAIRDSEYSNDEFTINGKNSSYSWSTNINIYKDATSKFRNCTKIVSCEIDSNVIDVANTINNFIFYTSSHHDRGYGEYEITLKQNFPQSALKNLHLIDKNEIDESTTNELEQRAKKHRKKNKGLGWYPGANFNSNAGDVEKNISIFNAAQPDGGIGAVSSVNGNAIGEEIEKLSPDDALSRLREMSDEESNTVMDAMRDSFDKQEDAYLGAFWYDPNKQEVYGQKPALASDCPWYKSSEFGTEVRTGRALHKSIWTKESKRGKDNRFSGDYTLKPRGRVFEFKDNGYKICVGNWIDNYPEAIDEIILEFQLPKENIEVIKNKHWDLGHGWSNEF